MSNYFNITPVSGSGNGTITISPKNDNYNWEDKVCTLTLTNEITSTTISIRQVGVPILFYPASISVDSQSQDIEVDVSARTNWSITNYPSWLVPFPLSGTSATEGITFDINANESSSSREGNITFSCSGYTVLYSVSQSAHISPTPTTYLSSNPSALTFTSAQESSSLTIIASSNWQMSQLSDNWITVNPTSGVPRETVLTVTVNANNTSSVRDTTLEFATSSDTLSVGVSQSGTTPLPTTYITVTPSAITATTAETIEEVTVNSSSSWAATSSVRWIEVNPSSGSAGNTTVEISIARKMISSLRTGTVTFTNLDSDSANVSVTQK